MERFENTLKAFAGAVFLESFFLLSTKNDYNIKVKTNQSIFD